MTSHERPLREILLKLHSPEAAAIECAEINAQMRIDKTLDYDQKAKLPETTSLQRCHQFSGTLVTTREF